MRYIHYDNANVDVSELCLGTWGLDDTRWNGHGDYKEAIEVMHALVDQGVNLIDTAANYGNGLSEKVVGKFLQEIDRSKVLISTKFGTVNDLYTGGVYRDASFRNVIRECASSLKNLKTGYIDFYFMHWPDVSTPISETMAALEHLRKMGYIRFIGLSNTELPLLKEAMKYGRVDVIQPPFSLIDQRYKETMEFAKANGIAVMGYGSMGGGVLTGKHRTMPDWPKTDVRFSFYKGFTEPKFSKIQELFKVVDPIAEKYHAEVSQVILNWTVQQSYVSSALIGITSMKHVEENLKTFDFELTEEEIQLINDEVKRLELDK